VRLDEYASADQNPLAVAFRTLHKIHHPRPLIAGGGTRHYSTFDPTRIVEDFGDRYYNTLAVPLLTGHPVELGHLRRDALGVFELTNKFTTLGGRRDYIPTTWEDLKLVSYMAEVAAVLVFQGLQASDHEADYERRIHGIKINLIGVRDSLQQLEDRGNISRLLPEKLQYHISNSIEWVKEMEQQVGRADRISRLHVRPEPMSLQSGVLAQAVKAARDSARAREIEGFSIDVEDILDRRKVLPLVLLDQSAFLTVMRNLFENSMKYQDREKGTCRIDIWSEVDEKRSLLLLHYTDNGIGIPRHERPYIFEEGYRGRAARRVNVQGEGLGLHECTLLMQAMNGTITCESPSNGFAGASFTLTLPIAKRD